MARSKIPSVTLDDVLRTNRLLPYRVSDGVTGRSDKVAIRVLQRFLGVDWIDKHINAGRGFLRILLTDDKQQIETHRMRRIILAEMLFNLQNIPGFKHCIADLLAGQIESTYAVLEIARLIVGMALDERLTFRFVPATRIKRRSYDLSIRFSDGVRACGEAKCKMEETAITRQTIETAISAAKKQLPLSAPGIVFVKVPSWWVEQEGGEFLVWMRQFAHRSMSRTRHIVSIIYYVSSIVLEDTATSDFIGERIGVREEFSQHHQFKKWRTRNWQMFPRTGPARTPEIGHYNGIRGSWQKILFENADGVMPMARGKPLSVR